MQRYVVVVTSAQKMKQRAVDMEHDALFSTCPLLADCVMQDLVGI